MMDSNYYYFSKYAFGKSEIENLKCEFRNNLNNDLENYSISDLLENYYVQNKQWANE